MLIAMVARALDPGCKVDEALVFEGAQGALKSSALGVIGGEYFKELTADPNSKDFEHQLRGCWLGEFPELHAMRRTDDIARIKQFITCRKDTYRPPYGRDPRDYPRRAVLCGTTNEECWIHDPTGGRRFIPVKVSKIDLAWLRENREQLFAEAVALFKLKRRWWIYPKQEALAQQDARRPADPWEGPIYQYLQGRAEIADLSELLERAVQVPVDRQTHQQLTRAGTILKKLGCVQQNQRRVNGRRSRPWSVPKEYAGARLVIGGPFEPVTPTEPEPVHMPRDLIGDFPGVTP
jgi:predicted P-loop ATPase